MEMRSAVDTTHTAVRQVADAWPSQCSPEASVALRDRQANLAARARIVESRKATYSQAGRARLDEQWDEALEGFARVSEARVAERRDQAATKKAATVPSFLGGRQDQRGRDEVSTSSAIAPAPRKEVGGKQAERDGTTIAKKKARLVEKAEFRPYASVMRKAPTGASALGSAPKLSEFVNGAADKAAGTRAHAEAMQAWLKTNLSKRAITDETRVRTCKTRTLGTNKNPRWEQEPRAGDSPCPCHV